MTRLSCRNCGAVVASNAAYCSECGVQRPAASNLLLPAEGQFPASSMAKASRCRRRGSQGLILGAIGCCFGALGILTLGLVFVPLAILFSLFGLLRGIVNQSGVGIVTSMIGLTLSAIGFFFSPSLWLLTGGLLLASQTGGNSAARATHQTVETADAGPKLPEQETKFCNITSAASEKYFDLASDADKAHDNENGISAKRAEDAMTATARDRDNQTLKLAAQTNFKFQNWVVQLLKVSTPNEKRLTFAVRPLCSGIVTIHLTTAADPALLDALSDKKPGYAFLVSGTFVRSRLDSDNAVPTPPDAKQFEQSITERGSMQEPEYWAHLN